MHERHNGFFSTLASRSSRQTSLSRQICASGAAARSPQRSSGTPAVDADGYTQPSV